MSIFSQLGIKFEKKVKDTSDQYRTPQSPKRPSTMFGGQTGIPNEAYRNKVVYSRVLDSIRFPDPGNLLDDVWKQVEFNELMKGLIECLEGPHFSVTAIRELRSFYDGKVIHDTWAKLEVFQRLRKIHCVKYRDLPKKVIDQIIPYINEVLNYGNDINGKTKYREETKQLK